jgi:eukaryotic-like serine/threonine-protein kinase
MNLLAAAAANLEHPNIVAIHETGEHEGQHYFSMQLVEGVPLTDLAELYRQDPRRSARLLRKVAGAVHHAHQRGILHRDLKPANILVDDQDEPHLTDFGLAKRVDLPGELTRTDTTLGTPDYMSPEQAQGHHRLLTVASDVWSLGAVLYFLLTGRPPLHRATPWQTMEAVVKDQPVRPRVLNPGVPRDLETICLKCLEKEPGKRYGSAEALAQDLGRFLEGQSVLCRPVSRVGETWRWCRRKPMVAGLAAAVVFMFLLGFAGVVWQAQRATQARDLAQGRLYAAQMKLAHAAIKEGKTGGALAMLRALQPGPGEREFRGFDWRYLYGLCLDSPSEALATNASGYSSVDLSPDGRTMALGTRDGWVESLDIRTRRQVQRPWRAHASAVDRLAFYPRNTNWLATISGGVISNLKLWDLHGQRLLLSIPVPRGQLVNFAWSANGRFLVTQATNALCVNLWELREGAPGAPPILVLKTNLPFNGPAVFSPDGRTLALCNGNLHVGLYDLMDGSLTNLSRPYLEVVSAADFSPDGSLLVTGGADECAVLWDVKQRTTLWIQHLSFLFATSVVFTPDGLRLFASGWDQNVRSCSIRNPQEIHLWRGHSAPVNGLAMAPDGRFFVSASDDGTARIWDLQPPDSGAAAAAASPCTILFSPAEVPSMNRDEVTVFGLAVSPAQDRVVAAEYHRLLVCDPRTGTVLTNLEVGKVFSGNAYFTRLTFSPDGRQLAVGTANGWLALLDAANLGVLRQPVKLHAIIDQIAYALEGSILVTGGGYGSGIKLSDVASGQVLAEFTGLEGRFPPQPLAVSPDGKYLATGSPEYPVCIRDIASRRIVASTPFQPGLVSDLVFSPDGKWLAISEERGTIWLWEVNKTARYRRLLGHAGGATTLAFSSDSRTLASGGMDHTIRLWHPDIDQEVAILTGHSEWLWDVAFADHGNALLSGGSDGTLRLWRALSFDQIQAQEFSVGTIESK